MVQVLSGQIMERNPTNKIYLSFTDWEGHIQNNIISNMIKDIFECDIIITDPKNSDVNIVTIYGNKHNGVINEYREKTILWLGKQGPNI